MTKRHVRSSAHRVHLLLPVAFLLAVLAADSSSTPPERLPRLTVRWEDPGKTEIFVVEGARYQCRVATWPARILSLRVDGNDLLGPEGLSLEVRDARGRRLRPAPRDFVPAWKVWRGGKWRPAMDSRARMNVWNAGLWYWDAHLLDIPLVPEEALQAKTAVPAEPPAAAWNFAEHGDAGGWKALHNCELRTTPGDGLLLRPTGDDPYVETPPVSVPGPVLVELRVRTEAGNGAAECFWSVAEAPGYKSGQRVRAPLSADGRWHTVQVRLPVTGTLDRLRFDPPEGGPTRIAAVRIYPLSEAALPAAPVLRGELVFHGYRDQVRIEFRCTPEKGQTALVSCIWHAPDAAWRGMDTVRGRCIGALERGGVAVRVLAPPGGTFDPDAETAVAPLTGDVPHAWWVIRPENKNVPVEEAFIDDLDPVPAAAVRLHNAHWHGWNPAAGYYEIGAVRSGPAFQFSPAFDNPNRRIEIDAEIGSPRPRTIMVRSRSYTGILPATVLTDPTGCMLPVPVQSCKNFGGEREEPDDTAYGDAWFPVTLPRTFRIVHLYQRWGDHMLKQVSSIRFFHIYWHLSTGVSETTCFTIPHFMLHGVYVRIPDFRPYSGPFWTGQPQHSCLTWPGLLQYRAGGAAVRLMYDETRFYSICPNLARFTMYFHTSDGSGDARAEVMEIPQNDEMRTFIRLRYQWRRQVRIDGDARLNFRWLNMNDKAVPETLLWTDFKGRFQTRPVRSNRSPLLLGEPLAPEFAVAGSDGIPGRNDERYAAFVLVRRFHARLAGRVVTSPHLSALYGARYGDYWFCAPTARLALQAGDFIEADLMLMPSGEPTEPLLKPRRERLRFGIEGPRIEKMTIGQKIADFPAVVAAKDDVAACTLTGGHNALPLIVTNISAPGFPLLWVNGVWRNPQCHGGDGFQVSPAENGRIRWTFVLPLRHGTRLKTFVTRVSTAGAAVARVADVNGFPEIRASGPCTFRFRAPTPFAPGANTVSAHGKEISFEGRGERVRAVPLRILPPGTAGTGGDRSTRVFISAWKEEAIDLRTGGPATLEVEQLAPDGGYSVRVGGTSAVHSVGPDRRLRVRTTGPAAVHIERVR